MKRTETYNDAFCALVKYVSQAVRTCHKEISVYSTSKTGIKHAENYIGHRRMPSDEGSLTVEWDWLSFEGRYVDFSHVVDLFLRLVLTLISYFQGPARVLYFWLPIAEAPTVLGLRHVARRL